MGGVGGESRLAVLILLAPKQVRIVPHGDVTPPVAQGAAPWIEVEEGQDTPLKQALAIKPLPGCGTASAAWLSDWAGLHNALLSLFTGC